MKLVVAGSVAQRAGYGGHAWAFLQYLLGLQDLGHEVLFVDALAPSGDPARDRCRALFLTRQLRSLGVHVPVAVLGVDAPELVDAAQVRRFARGAAALVNVMGFLRDEAVLDAVPLRVFLDIDPGFGQMWRALDLADVFAGHDVHVTVGTNVGRPGCGVPTCGLDWLTTLPPVALRFWPRRPRTSSRFTSVASWRGPFGPVDFQGRRYGLRVHEMRRLLPLPQRTGAAFELALDIDPADADDRAALLAHGWRLVPPRAVAGSAADYRAYVQGSGAELLVAKQMYVATASGWLSDRSACYLATGRPVLAQDTGFADHLPLEAGGLLPFRDLDEAQDGVRRLCAEPDRHAAAARALAEEHLSSDVVLPRLLRALGLA